MRYLSIFLLLLLSTVSKGQTYGFAHIDNRNGLSNNQVEYIFKDSRGFMWFATNSGLNRYDGINFKVYKNKKHDPTTIPFNRVTRITEDYAGNLWLRMRENVYVAYDYKTDRFIQNTDSLLQMLGISGWAEWIESDANKNLYVCCKDKGIFRYDAGKGKTELFIQSDADDALTPGDIAGITFSDNYLWVLHKSWLVERFNLTKKKVDFRNSYFKEREQNAALFKYIFVDADNDIWIYPGRSDKGAAWFDQKRGDWSFLEKESSPGLSGNLVSSIIQDKSGAIWLATNHAGISIFDKKKNAITFLSNSKFDPSSICYNSILNMYCDDKGIVWVGTYKNGISYYHPDMFKFKRTTLYNQIEKVTDEFDCNCFLRDKQHNLWVGTNGSGLIKYNEKDDAIRVFKHIPEDPTTVSSNTIISLLEDRNQKLWVGTFLGGLNLYDNGKFTSYRVAEYKNDAFLYANSVYGLAEDQNNNIWIGTLGCGVKVLDASSKAFIDYNHTGSKYVLSLFADNRNTLYQSTDGGVCIVDMKKQKERPDFDHQFLRDSLAAIAINNTILDSRGLLWIATDNGLNIYFPATGKLVCLTTSDGMPSDEVVSLIEDNQHNIWAGTRKGLVYIRCKYTNGALDYVVKSFDADDGLPGTLCNHNAIYKDAEGQLYVGFIRGFVNFYPEDIVFNKCVPKPGFTDLLISGQSVRPGIKYNGRVIIDKAISELNKITLNPDETNFTVFFSSLDYINPGRNKYKYRLEGLEQDWKISKNGMGEASYSNLSPGKYKLVVYASNNDEVWSKTPLALNIEVMPPFWLSWWAFLIYFITLAIWIRIFVKYKLKKQKNRFDQEQKIIEANRTHELDELKFRFFTNVSHEFKTPLALIVTPLEKLLKESFPESQKELLNIMHRNAKSLLSMVNNILDFRKLDMSKMMLNVSTGDVIPFIRSICQSFLSLSVEKNIRLSFTTYVLSLTMDFDSEKLNKIISNLLSNAFKYTKKGSIELSVGIEEMMDEEARRFLSIKVSDTGTGIEKEHLNRIFERFYRIEKTTQDYQPGTGIGLHLVSEYVKLHNGHIKVESVVGEGSVFTVLLPITHSASDSVVPEEPLLVDQEKEGSVKEECDSEKGEDHADKAKYPLLLIIDDNKDFRNFTKKLFVDSYRVITAENGEEGYEKVIKQLPDLVLCDVMMPVMDGYEFCKKTKQDIRTSHIPIILLTAKTSEENKYVGIEAGADDYIAKPFNIDLLTLKISRIIERQKKNHVNFKNKVNILTNEIEVTSMDEKFVAKMVTIVEQHIDNPDFGVEDLSKAMGISRVYFYKKMLALTNKTPSEFIRFVRLKRAAELLKKSQMFVNEVAIQVGFNEVKYFRKYFTNEFGMTPNEYKKKYEK